MLSDRVQNELVGIFEVALANSLDVERKRNQDKKAETVKVTSVGRASRKSILRWQADVSVDGPGLDGSAG